MALRRYTKNIEKEILQDYLLQMKDADITIRSDLIEVTVRNESKNI